MICLLSTLIENNNESTDVNFVGRNNFALVSCSSSFHDSKDEDLKVIDVSPIKSLFCNMNLDNDG